jgi:hypothetical protein
MSRKKKKYEMDPHMLKPTKELAKVCGIEWKQVAEWIVEWHKENDKKEKGE